MLAQGAAAMMKIVTSRNFAIVALLSALFWAGAWLAPFLQYYAFHRVISVALLAGLLVIYARGFYEYFVAPKIDAAGLFYMGTWVYAFGELCQALWGLYARATGQEHLLMTRLAVFWVFIKSGGFLMKLAVPAVEEGAMMGRYSYAMITFIFLAGAVTAAALFFLAAPALERL